MVKLRFLGFCTLGHPMAWHLLEASHEVTPWSNSSAHAVKLAGTGNASSAVVQRTSSCTVALFFRARMRRGNSPISALLETRAS